MHSMEFLLLGVLNKNKQAKKKDKSSVESWELVPSLLNNHHCQ